MINSSKNGLAGNTLIELMVVLALLVVLAGLIAPNVGVLRSAGPMTFADSARSARARAIATGADVTIEHEGAMLRFLPDGRGLGEHVDPLTGEPK